MTPSNHGGVVAGVGCVRGDRGRDVARTGALSASFGRWVTRAGRDISVSYRLADEDGFGLPVAIRRGADAAARQRRPDRRALGRRWANRDRRLKRAIQAAEAGIDAAFTAEEFAMQASSAAAATR